MGAGKKAIFLFSHCRPKNKIKETKEIESEREREEKKIKNVFAEYVQRVIKSRFQLSIASNILFILYNRGKIKFLNRSSTSKERQQWLSFFFIKKKDEKKLNSERKTYMRAIHYIQHTTWSYTRNTRININKVEWTYSPNSFFFFGQLFLIRPTFAWHTMISGFN